MTDKEETKKEEIYVYSNGNAGAIEVVLTGRTAEKRSRSGNVAVAIHEITPADKANGSWKKWVSLKELFKIV